MAQKQPPPRRPLTVPLTAAGVLAGLALAVLGLPSIAALWFAAVLIAITHPPAVLTGGKVAGIVQPAHEGEEARVRKHREVSTRKTRLLTFTDLALPGWWPQWSWVTALLVAAVAGLTLPVQQFPFALVNAVAAGCLIAAYSAARRQYLGDGDPCPGVRIDALGRLATSSRRTGVLVTVGVVLAGGAGWVLSGLMLTGVEALLRIAAGTGWPLLGDVDVPTGHPTLVTRLPIAVVIGWLLLTTALWRQVCEISLSAWTLRVEARSEWDPRFEVLKLPSTPVTGRKKVGPATVDSFRCATGKTVNDYLSAATRLPGLAGDGVTVTVLQAVSEAMPGTFHPSEFEIVTWPAGDDFDFSTACADPALTLLAARVALARYTDLVQAARFGLEQIEPVTVTRTPEPQASEEPSELAAVDVAGEGERPIRPEQRRRRPMPEQSTDEHASRIEVPARPAPSPAQPRTFALDPDDPVAVAEAIFGEPDGAGPMHALHSDRVEDPDIYSDRGPSFVTRAKSAAAAAGSAITGGASRLLPALRSAAGSLVSAARGVVAKAAALPGAIRSAEQPVVMGAPSSTGSPCSAAPTR